ncbi:sugar transferase [Candidatus Peregrinibacteria bacterium]|nr:sugar transferase [Candidatus Peregrinibacteria bacterium]
MKKSEIALGLLRIPVDICMIVLAFLAAYSLRTVTNLIPGITLELDLTQFPELDEYLLFAVKAAALLIALFVINGMYSLKSSAKTSKELGRVIVLCTAWIMLLIAYFFLSRTFPFSRLALGYAWILTIVFLSAGRLIIRTVQYALLKAGIGKRRVLFLGSNKVSEELKSYFSKNLEYAVLGVATDVEELEKAIKEKHAEEIIQTKSDFSHADSKKILEFCREHHILYHFVPDLVQVQRTNIEISSPVGIPLISLKPTPLDGWGRVIKRIFDIFGAVCGLIVLSPIFLITAIAVKLDSKGTVIFKYLDDGSRVKRVGEHGKLFNFYKFRSMYPNTHNLRYTELARLNKRAGTPMVKIKNDPRVTRVGKFIRKTSIDELPQLWNVLKGDMSLVGPRPHLPEEVAKYEKHHKFALAIKPGITGPAQIAGRSDLDFEQEIQLDTYYIENWSLWLDIKIILKTFGVVFRNDAAKDV